MKNENIPADVKSKSIKEAKDEINDILNKLEKDEADLSSCLQDYQRLLQLNKHVDTIFKKRSKELSNLNKNIKKDDKK